MSADAIEREVQKRLTERLVSGGVDQGRISLEVLYFLPPDFVRAYRRLFDSAMGEDVVGSGGMTGDAGQRISPGERIGHTKEGEAVVRKASSRAGGGGAADGGLGTREGFVQGARPGGRKYRGYWKIRSEKSFKLKGSVDRKLKRLARDIENALGKGKGEEEGNEDV